MRLYRGVSRAASVARHLARPRTATARASRRRRRVTAGAAISPQYAWSWMSHLGAFVSTAPLCRGGVVFTTGSRLRSRPKEFYEHLRDTLRGMEPEAGHYLERLAQLAFGGVEAAASS